MVITQFASNFGSFFFKLKYILAAGCVVVSVSELLRFLLLFFF